MRKVKISRDFRKDYLRLKNSGRRKMDKLQKVMEQLAEGETLDFFRKDHKLKGKRKGYRDCHIEGDWILIYRLELDKSGNEVVVFCATDNHANLFK